MKKGFLLILLFFFLARIALAQEPIDNFYNYQSLDMAFKLTSGVTIASAGGPQKIGYLQTDLSFFPRDGPWQTVTNFNPQAQPSAKTSATEKYTTYKWSNVNANALAFSVDALVKTTSDPVKIKQPSKFPVTNIEGDLLPFTKPTKFIDLTPAIEQQAYQIIGGENDLYKAVFKLADWTRNNIDYDLNTLTAEAVQPSSWVLQNREGVCDEMTNLFISFTRSVGIPAKFVSGMVYTNLDHDWGPHGWAEVYFPGYGWIPFDVTFGQYGRLDPSHIKLKESDDSGSPSAEYSWQATGVEVKVQQLVPAVTLVKTGQLIPSPVTLSIEPLRKNVGFSSYVPILVTVTNNQNYYLAPSLIIRKAPELTENNVKEVLLKPGETKTVGWIATIPTNLEQEYIYTGVLEVASSYGDTAASKIIYAAEYPVFKQKEAESVLHNLQQREEKPALTTLQVKCTADQELYYKNETAKVDCTVKNTGTDAEVDVCLRTECRKVGVQVGEERKVQFEVALEASGRIPVTAETADGVASAYVNINLVALPELYVTDLTPDILGYKDEVQLAFNLNADSEVRDVKVNFKFGKLDLASFKGARQITVDTDGKTLFMHGLKFTASFVDEKGQQHEQKIAVPIKVEDVPWYAKAARWMRNIF